MPVVARLNQYASLQASEFDEINGNNVSVSAAGTYYSNEFVENVGVNAVNNIFSAYNVTDSLYAEVTSGVGLSYPGQTLTANVYQPYNLIDGEFALPLYGAGQGTYMRQNYAKSLIIYNEIDEITTII